MLHLEILTLLHSFLSLLQLLIAFCFSCFLFCITTLISYTVLIILSTLWNVPFSQLPQKPHSWSLLPSYSNEDWLLSRPAEQFYPGLLFMAAFNWIYYSLDCIPSFLVYSLVLLRCILKWFPSFTLGTASLLYKIKALDQTISNAYSRNIILVGQCAFYK